MVVREMTANDVDAVRYLDAAAFTPYLRKTGRGDSFPVRSRETVLSCLALNPSGCFVAEENSDIIGYIFSRSYGSVGWVGTFGVHPDKQGKGIGKQLLKSSSDVLERIGCEVIGLETMPDSPYNVGFYAKAGFRLGNPSLVLARKVESASSICPATVISDASQFAILSSICRTSFPGLDYADYAKNTSDFGFGETILIGSPEPWAAAIMKPMNTVLAAVIVALPDARNAIGEIIQSIDTWAYSKGICHMILNINTSDHESVQWLLSNGFSVQHIGIRMLLKGEYRCPDGLDMCGWAM